MRKSMKVQKRESSTSSSKRPASTRFEALLKKTRILDGQDGRVRDTKGLPVNEPPNTVGEDAAARVTKSNVSPLFSKKQARELEELKELEKVFGSMSLTEFRAFLEAQRDRSDLPVLGNAYKYLGVLRETLRLSLKNILNVSDDVTVGIAETKSFGAKSSGAELSVSPKIRISKSGTDKQFSMRALTSSDPDTAEKALGQLLEFVNALTGKPEAAKHIARVASERDPQRPAGRKR